MKRYMTSSLTKLVAVMLIAAPVLSACDSAEERVASHMDRGVAYFDAADYDRARVEFKAALQLKPTIGRAYYYVGRVYEEQRLWADAMRAFDLAVEHEPDHIDANIRLGRYFVLTNKLSKALARAEHVISIAGGASAEGYALRAATALAMENTVAARKDAHHALVIEPGNATATSVLVGLYRKAGEAEAAIEVLGRALEKAPTNTALRLTKIRLHLDLNQRHEAEADSIALLKIEPRVMRHYIDLARIYVGWGRLDDAEATLRELVKHRPESADAKLALIDFFVNQRSADTAKKALGKFIEQSPEEDKMRFALAELYRRDGETESAVEVLRTIGTLRNGTEPGNRARAILAGLLASEGKFEAAKREISAVLKEDPTNIAVVNVKARIALKEGRYADAIQTLRAILRNEPNSAEALTLLSESYLARGEIDLAIGALDRLAATQPQNVAAWAKLGRLLATQGQFDSALNALNEALKRDSRDIRALSTKAKVLLAQRNYDQATLIAEKISMLPDGETASLNLLGRVAAAKGQHTEAVKDFRSAFKTKPGDWETTDGLVRSLAKSGDLTAATALLRDAVARDPEHERAWLMLGDALAARNEISQAIAAYRKASEVEPQSISPYERLAALQPSIETQDEVFSMLHRAVENDPTNKSLRVSLAIALENAEKFDEAMEVYDALIAEGHRDVVIVNNLAALIADHAYADRERLQQAITAMRPFENSRDSLVVDTIGWLQFRAGNLQRAISFLEKAVALNSGHQTLRRHLGEVYRIAGNETKAREYLAAADAAPKDANAATMTEEKR